MKSHRVSVKLLARVEGEGALDVRVRDGRVEEVRFSIHEPPRFFEAFLRGRSHEDVADFTSRICGICPVAYQMSAVHALESAFGLKVPPGIRELRRLIYCGEWIESHGLHIFLLHAPDFFGLPDAFELAKKDRSLVETALRLKRAGNDLVGLIGGREIHPVSMRVGGFFKAPSARGLRGMLEELRWARDAALKALRWACGLKFPEFEQDYEFVALRHEREYPFNEGRIASSKGLDIGVSEFNAWFEERQVPYSTALHSVIRGRGPYLAGPLARFNLNFDRLPESVRGACADAGLLPPVLNPFKSIAVRAAEILFACEEALRIIENYEEPGEPFLAPRVGAGEGHGATEAPRGLLYHRYRVDAEGRIVEAQIVPPTAQNQARIEADLLALAPRIMDLPDEAFALRCEQAVRNYDPCISCSTHCLKVRRIRL